METEEAREQPTLTPPGKVKPPKLTPQSPQRSSSEEQEVPSNPELQDDSPKDQVIAPDGSPEPKQNEAPLY